MKVGDLLPSFSLPDQDWNNLDSSVLLGAPCVIYFYPKDETPGCTKQACSFRNNFTMFEKQGARIIGISTDSPESHLIFREKYNLPYTLLSDQDSKVHKLFDVKPSLFGLIPGRVTFVFDKDGVLAFKFNSQLLFENHVTNSLEELKKLQTSV